MHRCRLLADAIVRAHERGAGQARLEDVEARFGEEGISLDRPYLNPGSSRRLRPSPASTPAVTYLETAAAIGRQIADAAIWHGGRCTWVGAMPEEGPAGPRMTYAWFGPDLYGGTAGSRPGPGRAVRRIR